MDSTNTSSSVQRKPRKQRAKVLIVICGDGFIEAYAEKDEVAITCVEKPYMESRDGDTEATQRGEIRAEEYVDHKLPLALRSIYWPGNRQLIHKVVSKRPSDLTVVDIDTNLPRMVGQAFVEAATELESGNSELGGGHE